MIGRLTGRQPAHRFTLVELLVVIVIISILMSMLLPSLNTARETGRDSVCRSNLRQLTLGLVSYIDDHEGYYPIMYKGSVATSEGWRVYSWRYRLEPYVTSAVHTLTCPSNQDAPNNGPSYAPVNYGGGAGWQNRGCSPYNWERFGMLYKGGRIRMGAPDGCNGKMTFSPGDTWGMDPVDPEATYFVETSSVGWTTAAAHDGTMVTPHGVEQTRMNYIGAGLGIYQIDFRDVSPADMLLHLNGSGGSWPWYRVQTSGKPAWPAADRLEQLSGDLFGSD